MIVNSCNFNDIFFELDIKLSKKEFIQSEKIIKERLLFFAYEILKKFGQSKKLVLSKYLKSDEDLTITCVYLIK